MKKVLFLALVFPLMHAMQAPVGLAMEDTNESLSARVKTHIKNCPKNTVDAVGRCVDHTFCCGCLENAMETYLERRSPYDPWNDWLRGEDEDEETACGCLLYNYCKETNNEKPCDPCLCSIVAVPACLATLPLELPIFYLIQRRFEKVKNDVRNKLK